MDVYGLIGDPVEGSLSPVLFNAAFEAAADAAVYGTFPVGRDHLTAAVEGAHALGIAGINVTAPHKQAVAELVDVDPRADRIGAVNLVDLTTDPPTGANTDAVAMDRVLETTGEAPGEALVLGAGGAAAAYVDALVDARWHVTVANRTSERATRLAEGAADVEGIGLDRAPDRLGQVDLVVNATPVGQDEPGASPIPTDGIEPRHVVIDAVYRPVWTHLLRGARARGATVVPGTRLLLEQALAGYRRWRERPPPADAMRIALDVATGPTWSFKYSGGQPSRR